MPKQNSFNENEVIVYLDKNIYSKDSVFKCLYWYGDKYHTSFSTDENGNFIVKLKTNSKSELSNLENLLLKLEKDLVDFSLRDIVTKETINIRNLLIAKAFSNGEFEELPIGDISDPVGFNPNINIE
jgi:His-Xaa-Ser system protein HxsD